MVTAKGKPNFTEGPIFTRLLLFTLPIIATSLLQVLYNMADNIVVGQFSGDPDALAAVGQTSAYTNLLINILIGISAGAGVVVAQLYGAMRRDELKKAIHTAMALSLILGAGLLLLGLAVTPWVLSLIVKAELLPKSTLYMMIVCAGLPALSIYNFGASIMRSLGDSKTPLVILSLSGILNVVLNLIFVIPLRMSIAGVALATIISQYASAVAVVILMLREKDEDFRLDVRQLRIYMPALRRTLMCGIPAALQSSVFSFANMILASAVGTLPTTSISANTIASNIDGITYQCMNAFTSSVMTFAGQNYGAMKRDRMWKSFIYGVIQVTVIGIAVGGVEILFGEPISSLFIAADNPNRDLIIAETRKIMITILVPYFLCGIMGVMGGYLRGLGYSTSPMLASVISVLVVRITWIFFVFYPSGSQDISFLYLCFPITWIVTILIEVGVLIYVNRKMKKLGFGEEKKTDEVAVTAES